MNKTRILAALMAGASSLVLAIPSVAKAQTEQSAGISSQADPDPGEGTEEAEDSILVTGTRIRGARVTGDVIELDRDAIVAAGQIDLGEAIRSLPQNFSGGQNPGVGSGAGLVNSNVNSASSPNLRGLGPDATLTILNGHRLPYDSAFAGVDISAIPLAAIDRVEVLPDGASALYGSDAVAGVINVVLRRDFEGVQTSTQLGTSTDGGYFRQQADIVAGTIWEGGGAFVAYDFAHNSEIAARQRDYAGSLEPDATLFPSQERHAATLSARHEFSAGFEAGLDALYSHRTSTILISTPTFRSSATPQVEAFSIAPYARLDLGAGWQASFSGVFGRDRTDYRTQISSTGTPPSITEGCICNELSSLEAGAEGPLFTLPGGEVRLAAGLGIRSNSLNYTRIEAGVEVIAFNESQRARFAYGELFLPLVSDRNASPGIAEFSLSAAIRHEDYPGLDEQTTPRFGMIYAPVEGFTFKASWARSFKAPTLFQRFVPYQTILLPASIFGAGTGPQTLFYTSGGNPSVTSEKARTWTAGVELRPARVPELSISATWYDIRYRDRVARPIAGSIVSAFRNPGYASLIDFTPDPGTLAELLAGSLFGLENFSGSPFDPANVVAWLDNRNSNVSAWAVNGIDARISWNEELGKDRSIALELAASMIDSEQQVTDDLPAVQLSGTIFNPPDYRGRATVAFRSSRLGATASVNYTGALSDRRQADTQRLSASATVDFGLSYEILRGPGRDPGLELSLNVQNLFDKGPEELAQTAPTDTPYDSTNYSPLGRFVSIGIRRQW